MPQVELPTEARVAVVRVANEPMTLESYPLPQLIGSEALVKIRCATICGSDLHSFFGRRPTHLPCVLGHEMVGTIVAMGPLGTADFNGRPLKLGDRVTWSMVWSCGECYYCQRELCAKCEQLKKFGHEKLNGERAFLGGLAEYCLLGKKTAIFVVPENLSDLIASPANCATATVSAIFRNAQSVAGQTVVVQGAGMLGQTACAMAANQDAKQIIMIEPNPVRRQQSLRFGATRAIDGNLANEVIRQLVLELTSGRGADLVIELAGYPEAIELGVELLRFGGRYVLAGATFPCRPTQLSAEQLVRSLIQIVGVYNYNPTDLESALKFLSQIHEKYPFEELIGASFPLDQVNHAFEFAEHQRPPRVAVIP